MGQDLSKIPVVDDGEGNGAIAQLRAYLDTQLATCIKSLDVKAWTIAVNLAGDITVDAIDGSALDINPATDYWFVLDGTTGPSTTYAPSQQLEIDGMQASQLASIGQFTVGVNKVTVALGGAAPGFIALVRIRPVR